MLDATPLVYMCLSEPDEDGDCIERIALHPGLDTQPMGQGAKFEFRVVWRWARFHTLVDISSTVPWYASCRGKDYRGDDMTPDPDFGAGEMGLDAALQWLLEGEVPNG